MAKNYVQAGKAVTSKRGILGEGVEVEVKDFVAGETAIKGLIKRGALGPNNPVKTDVIVVEDNDKKEKKDGGGAEKK